MLYVLFNTITTYYIIIVIDSYHFLISITPSLLFHELLPNKNDHNKSQFVLVLLFVLDNYYKTKIKILKIIKSKKIRN